MVKRGQETRRVRASSHARHRVGLVLSVLLAVAAAVAIGTGVYAWSMPHNPPTRVPAGQDVDLGVSPWFDPGTTLFMVPESDRLVIDPAAWDCVLRQSSGEHPLRDVADPDVLGSRVVNDHSVVPVLTIGPTQAGDTIRCSGPTAEQARAWALPTNPGVPRVPVSLIIAGVALAGMSALVHPRWRGIQRFGR